jgi:hypothetical protein
MDPSCVEGAELMSYELWGRNTFTCREGILLVLFGRLVMASVMERGA